MQEKNDNATMRINGKFLQRRNRIKSIVAFIGKLLSRVRDFFFPKPIAYFLYNKEEKRFTQTDKEWEEIQNCFKEFDKMLDKIIEIQNKEGNKND